MTNQKIVDYVMNTPGNTNRMILGQMLDSRETSWNDLKDKPFYVDEKRVLVVEGVPTDPLNGGYDVSSILEEGKLYTYIVDGVEFSGYVYYHDSDGYTVNLMSNDNLVGAINQHNIFLRPEFYDVNASHKIELVEERVIHKLDARYLPDPFWVEEVKNTLIAETTETVVAINMLPDGIYYDHTKFKWELGEKCIIVWDGIEYESVCVENSDACYEYGFNVDGYNVGFQENGIIFSHGNNYLQAGDTHTYAAYKKEAVYHTHHDFMVISKFNEDTGENSKELVAGDFAFVKAKILKGLPATAYVINIFSGDGHQEVINYVTDVGYSQWPDIEHCFIDRVACSIMPDNTIAYS